MARNSLDDFKKRMKAIPKAARVEIAKALEASAEEMAATARRFAPVRTGALRDSIVVTPAGEATPAHSQPGGAHVVPELTVAVTAGNTKVRYAHLVEHGTVDTPAQPFFWPAYRLHKKRVKSRMSRAMGKAAKAARGT